MLQVHFWFNFFFIFIFAVIILQQSTTTKKLTSGNVIFPSLTLYTYVFRPKRAPNLNRKSTKHSHIWKLPNHNNILNFFYSPPKKNFYS